MGYLTRLCVHEVTGSRDRKHGVIRPGLFRGLNLSRREDTPIRAGHKIEDYFTLKDTIKKVVRNGKLAEFVDQGMDEDWASSNAKRKAHMRNVMLVNPYKSLYQQGKLNIEFGDDDEEFMCDEEGNDPMTEQTLSMDRDPVSAIRPTNSEIVSNVVNEACTRARSRGLKFAEHRAS
ncbi:hypothetical protein J1N35_041026 [Gossypium stocksii]|uniref:Uncharacterized protein n=1 Tax=Gossypium stocksii TaxID=47602 RepID=A0A9D3ZJ15_9ROSI|nr:hypothetical protein J1N35_041026 [Gossypium stocksii]